MQISFEGETLHELEAQMRMFLTWVNPGADWPADETVPAEDVEEEAPKKTRKRTTVLKKPAPEKVEEEEEIVPEEAEETVPEETEDAGTEDTAPGKNLAETRRKAISKLVELYNLNEDAQQQVKALLGKYDIKKFSEVSDERVSELLTDANKIAKKVAA